MYGTERPQFALPKPTLVSTNQDMGERLWGNKRRKSMPWADFDGRRRTLVLVPEEASKVKGKYLIYLSDIDLED